LRISSEHLAERRRGRTGRILLTGGTGFLGSHILHELLTRGYSISLLARANGQFSAEERVRRLLDWFGLDGGIRSRLEVIEGCIDQPNLGLNPHVYTALLNSASEIVHCASDTSFSARKKADLERTNIDGLKNLLDFAATGRCSFFHYLSTAYVAGRKKGVCKEELVENKEFTNHYEETKCRAEWMVSERCGQEGIRLSIYRPSIVYGNSETGRSIRFNAVYYPIKMLLFLKSLFESDIREQGGRRAGEMGVKLTHDGFLHLPIRVPVAENGGLNLVPVNYFTDAFVALMEESLEGGVFHIVNPRLTRIEDLIYYVQKLFGLEGLEPDIDPTNDAAPRNALESLYDRYLEVYVPYMTDVRIFDDRKSLSIREKRAVACPDFDLEVFSRCIKFAIECEWGSKLFEYNPQS
jgi:nucleoside-diphosphate-sugar epimerase